MAVAVVADGGGGDGASERAAVRGEIMADCVAAAGTGIPVLVSLAALVAFAADVAVTRFRAVVGDAAGI